MLRFLMLSLAFVQSLTLCSPASAETEKGTPIKLSSAQIDAIKRHVRSSLKDPESARFGEMGAVKTKDGETIICGRVNAKNSYGGYTGMTTFMGSYDKKGPHVVVASDDSAIYSAVCGKFGVPSF